MNSAARIACSLATLMVLMALLVGCGSAPPGAGKPAPSLQSTSPPPASSTPHAQNPPAATASTTASVEPTRQQPSVTVRAKGNVFIRRGPDVAFNPVSVLRQGKSALATGRDVLGDWLRIPLPDRPSQTGWISIMTQFTEVTGDVHALQEIEPAEWPQLASLRNCTYHEMMLQPGGLVLPSILYFPDNDVRVNPGTYHVVDVDVDEYPDVLTVDIREGSSVDVIVDGNGMKKKCPLP